MPIKSRRHIRWGVATAVIALGLGGLPLSLDLDALAFGAKTALADAGGNGKGKGHGHSHDKGVGTDQSQEAELTKTHLSKDDPMHPSNLGRLNGFLHASPQALANASPDSAIGILSKTYRDALAAYATSLAPTDPATTTDTTTLTTDDMAAILAKAANKPLSAEQIAAINDKLASANPDDLADYAAMTDEEKDQLASDLADQANAIQDTETNQGLGSGDDAADDGATDDGDAAAGSDTENSDDGVVAAAADSVTQAAEDTADAVGDFIDDTF